MGVAEPWRRAKFERCERRGHQPRPFKTIEGVDIVTCARCYGLSFERDGEAVDPDSLSEEFYAACRADMGAPEP